MDLVIDQAANCVVIDGHAVRGRRRWEAAVLAALVDGGHRSTLTAASAPQMDALLACSGQGTPLTRKQWGLIWQSLGAMFAEARSEDALAKRLRHPPRGLTVGPWWWEPQEGDRVELTGPPLNAPVLPPPRLAVDGSPQTTAALCRQFLVAQGMISDGQLQAASDALADECAWAGTTPELHALRHLRLGEVELLRRNFHRARSAWRSAGDAIASNDVAYAYLATHVALLEHRIAYAQQPVADAARILGRLSPLIRRPAHARSPEVDPLARGLTLNLAALCERRWIEQHAGREYAGSLKRHAEHAMDCWSAALFGFLVSSQHEQVHNMCSNVGYLFQRLCELNIDASAECALQWYALAQAWHNRFDLPDNTVWEYIFLGDFWLGRSEVRALMDQAVPRSSWAGRHPGSRDFYEYSAQRAREIGDPRQIAHTALNLWRYSRDQGRLPAIRRARDDLERTLAEHPDLRTILTAEGYGLPDARLPSACAGTAFAPARFHPRTNGEPYAALHG